MKRTRLRKKSKDSIRKVQDLIWIECRRIIAEQFGTDCYTCEAKGLTSYNRQLGHVPYPKASLGAYLKYDLRCLRYQCFHCNINLGGNGAVAYERMLKEEGKIYMDKLKADRKIIVKSSDFFRSLLEEYKTIKI